MPPLEYSNEKFDTPAYLPFVENIICTSKCTVATNFNHIE